MYYEEKVINGVLCFRGLPTEPFREMSKEQLTNRIITLKSDLHTKNTLYEKAPWWMNPDVPPMKVTC